MEKAKDPKTRQSTATPPQSSIQRIVVIFAVAAFAYTINAWFFSTTSSDPLANTCPGYRASNVVKTSTGLTADLQIAGTKCNVFGTDVDRLKLSVNYDSGMLVSSSFQTYN